MKTTNTQKGFTLIELMVVVSIIALLSSIVVASLTDARGGAKNNVRNETARQYITAMALYHGEYGHYPKQGLDNDNIVCLGSDHPGNSCRVMGQRTENSVVNNAISEFAPSNPASLEKTVSDGVEYFGIQYRCTDNSCADYSMYWIVEGFGNNANCFGGATKDELSPKVSLCTYSTIQQTEI